MRMRDLIKIVESAVAVEGGELHPEVRQMVTSTMAQLHHDFPQVAATVAFVPRTGGHFDPWTSEIRLPVYGKDKPLAAVDHEEDRANRDGYCVKAGLRATLLHEFGHAINHAIIQRADEATKDEWFDAKAHLKQTVPAVSDYANKNTSEWVAERFAAEYLGQAEQVLIPVLLAFLTR